MAVTLVAYFFVATGGGPLTLRDVVGTYEAEYFISQEIRGMDRLILRADGSYVQKRSQTSGAAKERCGKWRFEGSRVVIYDALPPLAIGVGVSSLPVYRFLGRVRIEARADGGLT
jgi:hypothetical protein